MYKMLTSWIGVLLVFDIVRLVFTDTYSFATYCNYKEWSIMEDKTHDVTYNGETLPNSPCRMGFKGDGVDLKVCASTEDFNLYNCQNYIQIYGADNEDDKTTWKCEQSPEEVCADVDEVLILAFHNGNTHPGGNFRFEVYVYDESPIIAIIVGVCVGLAVIGTIVFVVVYCKYCKKGGNKTGTVFNTGYTANAGTVSNSGYVFNTDRRNLKHNYVVSYQGRGGMPQRYGPAFRQHHTPATQNSYGFRQQNPGQGGLPQQDGLAISQQQTPAGYGQPSNSLFAANNNTNQNLSAPTDNINKQPYAFSFEENASGPVPAAATYNPPPSQNLY